MACAVTASSCLKLETCERLWETDAATTATARKSAGATTFLVKNGDASSCSTSRDLIIAKLVEG